MTSISVERTLSKKTKIVILLKKDFCFFFKLKFYTSLGMSHEKTSLEYSEYQQVIFITKYLYQDINYFDFDLKGYVWCFTFYWSENSKKLLQNLNPHLGKLWNYTCYFSKMHSFRIKEVLTLINTRIQDRRKKIIASVTLELPKKLKLCPFRSIKPTLKLN